MPQTPPAVTPIVREVERAILETGLFRTVDVLFETDQATLLPPSQRTLDAIGAVLEKYPDLRIEVGGHADSRGPAEYNLRLSEARAAAVRDYLLERFPGIDPSRITVRGYGEARPIASNDTETGRALNRRVEFVVVGEGPPGEE
ncbi:MAG: OmpA family protein [Bacteroidetes bacterium]|nr:MAG: OmpA family protein [Bacteroidota bacterium]